MNKSQQKIKRIIFDCEKYFKGKKLGSVMKCNLWRKKKIK